MTPTTISVITTFIRGMVGLRFGWGEWRVEKANIGKPTPARHGVKPTQNPPARDQICEYAAGTMKRLVMCETVSAYCGSFLSFTQTGWTPNAVQFLLCVSRSGLHSM